MGGTTHRKDDVTPAVNASFGPSTMLQTDDRTLSRTPGPRPAAIVLLPTIVCRRVPRKAIEQAVVQVFGVGQEDLRR